MKAIKIKIKNTTSEIITEIASRLNVSTSSIQNEFHFYWHDLSIMMTHFLGHGLHIPNFCNLILNVGSINGVTKIMEKRIKGKMWYIDSVRKSEHSQEDKDRKIKTASENIAGDISKLIILKYSIQLYEKQVLSIYPKKYKPKSLYLEKYLFRLEKHFGISMAQFPIQINYHLQKIFVLKLQSEGILQNPLVYKNT